MEAHQQRVVDEKNELDEKNRKLSAFFETAFFDTVPETEQLRLKRQSKIMHLYTDVLAERIAAF